MSTGRSRLVEGPDSQICRILCGWRHRGSTSCEPRVSDRPHLASSNSWVSMSDGVGERAPRQDSVAGPICAWLLTWPNGVLRTKFDGSPVSRPPITASTDVAQCGRRSCRAGWQRRAGHSQRDHDRAQKCRRLDGVVEVTERPIDAKPGGPPGWRNPAASPAVSNVHFRSRATASERLNYKTLPPAWFQQTSLE